MQADTPASTLPERARTAYRVARTTEIEPGERKIVRAGKTSIGVFNVRGTYYAIRNLCPHQLAPLCAGDVSGTNLPSEVGEYRYGRDGEIIRCPWHKWEFDLTTGRSIFNPHRCRAKAYRVTVLDEAGKVIEREIGRDDPDPDLQRYPVEVQEGWVVVYV